MSRLAFAFLVCIFALSGCSEQSPVSYGQRYQGAPSGPTVLGGPGEAAAGSPYATHKIAILLPLSGPRAGLASVLLQAAQLAADGNGGSSLDVLDTAGTASGAVEAVNTALSHGDGIILGPLTSAETAAAAPAAQSAGIPVLAFTNDTKQARPGLWPLGISPGQQIRRLVAAGQAQGRTRFAALLPDTDFGHAMATALGEALQAAGLPDAPIRFHASGMASITAAVREISGYADRRGPIDAKIKELKQELTSDARRQIQELQKTPIPPPPFDILLLGDTGDSLQEIAAVLPYYDVDRSVVQIIGPALWGDRASGSGYVQGAWYAAPDSATRNSFVGEYQGRYGAAPPPIADLAYDAALIARFVSAGSGPYTAALTQPSGFIGSDGWISLMPDGHVRRGLAVFKLERGGSSMIDPPPEPSSSTGF
ncbi:MAG TPA: penicillin-binding protein activator [Rhodopila sp.]|jgi:branched-chain amino acid transport system substrate-binding protein|nr:penicillin-binding protein activator [Rhodopila sp.]